MTTVPQAVTVAPNHADAGAAALARQVQQIRDEPESEETERRVRLATPVL